MVIDYSKAKVYKIYCLQDENIFYIGATCQNLNNRLSEHRVDSKRNREQFVYKQIEKLGSWNNFKIMLIENCPCKHKKELSEKEKHYISLLNPFLNTQYTNMKYDKEKFIKV